MNNNRRKELNRIAAEMSTAGIDDLESIKSDIEMALMDEEMAFESMPENLQYSMRGEASQEAQDNMNEAIDLIDEFLSDYQDYEIDQIHDSEEDEDKDEDENEIEDRLQDLISSVMDCLDAAAM